MEFDLVSAYSARISWGSDCHVKTVECSGQEFYDSFDCDSSILSLVLVNLQPSKTYSVCLNLDDGNCIRQRFVTRSLDDARLGNLYLSIRNPDGVFDTTRLDKVSHDVFLKHFSDIVRDGDEILARVEVDGVKSDVSTVAVRDGSVRVLCSSAESNIFLPFSKDCGKTMQTVTLKSEYNSESESNSLEEATPMEEATLTYIPEEDSFGYGGDVYRVGDKFQMFGKMVTVAYGSIVLLFANTVAKTWPFQSARALRTTTDAGSHFMKNLTTSVLNLVGSKTTGNTGNTYNSAWIHNTTTSTTHEVTRMVHEIDASSLNGTLSLGVLHTDSSNNKFIEPVIQSSYDSTTISAQNSSDVTSSATFASTGLSFDTDDASIYFGSSQTFRISFTDGTPALLKIQSYDTNTSAYITRLEFSDAD